MNRVWPAIVALCLAGAGFWALRARAQKPAAPQDRSPQPFIATAKSPASPAPLLPATVSQPVVAPAPRPEPDPQVLLEKIRESNAVITQSADDHEKAAAWMALQEAEEELLPTLPQHAPSELCNNPDPASSKVLPQCPGREIVEEAQRLGADIRYCGSGESWLQGTNGHEQYLKLWPDGPKADRAFWKTAVEPPCCDECGWNTSDDLKNLINTYSTFLQKFPNSSLKDDAEHKLHEYENLLKKEESARK
jgi:hypothetical protein